MTNIIVRGGSSLQGTVNISGSSNSSLKLIAASLFSNEDVIFENIPAIGNIMIDLEVIRSLGGEARWVSDNKLLINGSGITTSEIPYDLGSRSRTVSLYAAALVYRFGKAILPIPKDCKIGFRPMNRWVTTWENLGLEVESDERNFYLQSSGIEGSNIGFKLNTHMGTDNAILFSIFVPGETIINNSAEEPEVDDLISFVNMIGADVKRVGERKIKVVGRNNFSGGSFKVMSDRNEVVTYAVGALITNGNVIIKGVDRKNLLSFVNVLTKMDVNFEVSENEMRVWGGVEGLNPIDIITSPYPGFMTDWQSLITLLLTSVSGTSTVYDTIYTDRFDYVKDLNRMGASIKLLRPSDIPTDLIVSEDTYDVDKDGEPEVIAEISGPTDLRGTKLLISDLRVGATLVLAALAAEGKSEIVGFENIDRGYEDFVEKFRCLGAEIEEVED